METKFKLFTAARAIAGISVQDFALNLGVTRQHIFLTLKNPRQSARISKAIDRFIKKNLPSANEDIVRKSH